MMNKRSSGVICTLQLLVRLLLPSRARLHPNNRRAGREEYPQLWDCWPKWTGRRHPRIFAVRVWLCGHLTGHEISITEWGYGGGKYVDRNCRWCDKTIRVPKAEEDIPHNLEWPVRKLGF